MTLKELAIELRKLFEFRYLTVDSTGSIYAYSGQKPEYTEEGGKKYWIGYFLETSIIFETWSYVLSLDMSEYEDDQGNIDYSKCIVEVSDASE